MSGPKQVSNGVERAVGLRLRRTRGLLVDETGIDLQSSTVGCEIVGPVTNGCSSDAGRDGPMASPATELRVPVISVDTLSGGDKVARMPGAGETEAEPLLLCGEVTNVASVPVLDRRCHSNSLGRLLRRERSLASRR